MSNHTQVADTKHKQQPQKLYIFLFLQYLIFLNYDPRLFEFKFKQGSNNRILFNTDKRTQKTVNTYKFYTKKQTILTPQPPTFVNYIIRYRGGKIHIIITRLTADLLAKVPLYCSGICRIRWTTDTRIVVDFCSEEIFKNKTESSLRVRYMYMFWNFTPLRCTNLNFWPLGFWNFDRCVEQQDNI